MTSQWSNSVLLIAMLLLLVVEPFLLGQSIFHTLVSVVLLAAVWVISPRPRLLLVAFALVIPAFLGRWLVYVHEAHWLIVASAFFAMSFFALTVVVLLWRALGSGATVTADTIAGAVCAYLLLGVVWAFAFSMIELAHPGAFLVNNVPMAALKGTPKILRQELLYMSLVTLSTVGYGDIVPVTPPARMLAVLEAVTGQIYLAVLIGGLVGMHMQRPRGA
jgi:Ion channel